MERDKDCRGVSCEAMEQVSLRTPKSLVFVFEKDKKSPKISVLKIANYEKIGKWGKAIKLL